ncbi:hypothetical protein [Roseococcus sp. YIM B11640]|uniref:hypothetical protein n=1 Tax=Roseococcus sp. YIM B11640 TaxID=3133973 RepID=UPI003C7A9165
MLRGSIEQVLSDRVSGWIYSSASNLQGATLLAYVDDECVGAGKVDVFRQDLADAGLGDGRFGYSFPVSLLKPDDGTRLIIKLEGSDALLKQAQSRIEGTLAKAEPTGALGLPQDTVNWMRRRAWLSQSDYDFLRYFAQLGIYDRSLASRVETAERIDANMMDPAELAKELFALLALRETAVERVTVKAIGDVANITADRIRAGLSPIVALWSRERGRVDVIEGSHKDSALQELGKAPVDYSLGPDRLVFLDARAAFGSKGSAGKSGLDVFFAKDE